jgi:hypothetical protein
MSQFQMFRKSVAKSVVVFCALALSASAFAGQGARFLDGELSKIAVSTQKIVQMSGLSPEQRELLIDMQQHAVKGAVLACEGLDGSCQRAVERAVEKIEAGVRESRMDFRTGDLLIKALRRADGNGVER